MYSHSLTSSLRFVFFSVREIFFSYSILLSGGIWIVQTEHSLQFSLNIKIVCTSDTSLKKNVWITPGYIFFHQFPELSSFKCPMPWTSICNSFPQLLVIKKNYFFFFSCVSMFFPLGFRVCVFWVLFFFSPLWTLYYFKHLALKKWNL